MPKKPMKTMKPMRRMRPMKALEGAISPDRLVAAARGSKKKRTPTVRRAKKKTTRKSPARRARPRAVPVSKARAVANTLAMQAAAISTAMP